MASSQSFLTHSASASAGRGVPASAASAAINARDTAPAGPWKSNPTAYSAYREAASTPVPTHHLATHDLGFGYEYAFVV